MMVAAFFAALLCILILGRVIIALMVIALVVIMCLLALMVSIPLLIVALPFLLIAAVFKKKINVRRYWDWDWDDDDDDDNIFMSNGSRIIINGNVMKCEKCDRNASSVINGKSRCTRHI